MTPTASRLALLDSRNPLTSDLPPGVRMVAGEPYQFDMDARLDWEAVVAKMEAPDDLSGLCDAALGILHFQALRLVAVSGGRDRDLLRQVIAEQRVRDCLSRAVTASHAERASRKQQLTQGEPA